MDRDIKYAELLRRNATLGNIPGSRHLRLAVVANITINALKEVLEFSFRSRSIAAQVTIGDYDNVAQDSSRFRDYDAIFVFYELAAIVDLLPFQLHRFDSAGLDELVEKAKHELSYAFDVLSSSRLVVFNELSAISFVAGSVAISPLEELSRRINEFVRTNAPQCFRLVNIEKVIAHRSIPESIDLRFFLSSRSLYKFPFLRAYSEFVFPLVGASAGYYKKVLVLDCDNTLWKGVIGEDGLEGIQVFAEVQSHFVRLIGSGVVICLCSKNNPADVDAALKDQRMVLRDEHVALKAVNWNDKVSNLREIATTLNLGLEALVYIDDSDFELEAVRAQLPAVTAFKVPDNYSDYLWLCQSICALFYREHATAEDGGKVLQYRTEFARQEARKHFTNMEEYLASLNLCISFVRDVEAAAKRLAQLTQKTNQFNLTTIRMTESEMLAAARATDHLVLGINVSDRFGDYGTAGLIIVKQTGERADVQNFLLSCRVIGRHIEFKAFDRVVELLRRQGVSLVCGMYFPTEKNGQVKDLYPKLGFRLVEDAGDMLRFELDLQTYTASNIEFVNVAAA
jgi:FkbH-like protein